MYFRKPVLASDSAPLKRIVNATYCGKVFKAGDSQDCAEKILEFYNEDLYLYGENGYNNVLNEYNWEKDGKNLLKLYEELR